MWRAAWRVQAVLGADAAPDCLEVRAGACAQGRACGRAEQRGAERVRVQGVGVRIGRMFLAQVAHVPYFSIHGSVPAWLSPRALCRGNRARKAAAPFL